VARWHYFVAHLILFPLGEIMKCALPLCLTCLTVLVPALEYSSRQSNAANEYDILIRNGTVIDGTGRRRFRADVAIKGDRIARVGEMLKRIASSMLGDWWLRLVSSICSDNPKLSFLSIPGQ